MEILGTLENPHKIEDGEIITQPGIYDMSIEWYHDACCDGHSVSSGGLRHIESASPLHYWHDNYNNPRVQEERQQRQERIDTLEGFIADLERKAAEFDEEAAGWAEEYKIKGQTRDEKAAISARKKEADAKAKAARDEIKGWIGQMPEAPENRPHFNLGQAAHTLFLGEDGFREKFAVRPADFPDYRSQEARAWRDAQLEAGRHILTEADLVNIKGMAHALETDPLIQSGILSGHVERSLIWKDELTGLWLKARPDVIPNELIVADLKTTLDASADGCRMSIGKWGYHMQLPLAGEGMRVLLGMYPEKYVLAFIETKAPWAINIKPIHDSDIAIGSRQCRRSINKIAECVEKNEWPGYADNGITGGLPNWYSRQMQDELDDGLLPDELGAESTEDKKEVA